MRVSEKVTIEEIKSWDDGDIITIEAGTGAGKSHFIKNNLHALAEKDNKKILMLIHRTNCVNQFQFEIKQARKTETIHIKTYQSIEEIYNKGMYFDFSDYKYIVCDEFHYFMNDAQFNKFTDVSLNAILHETDKVRIFMSATGDMMKRYINIYKKIEVKPYAIPITYNFIKSLTFFNKNDSLEEIAKKVIMEKKKAIFFIQSDEKAFELHKKFKEVSLFNCSKHNKKGFYKYVDENKIIQMLQNEKFEESLLITTTCFDAGVNIKDKDLQYIICDVKDTGTLIQCMGRKRLEDKNDGIHLLIKTIDNKSLGGTITQINKKLERARFLRKHDTQSYILKYPRDYDKWNIVYNDIIEDERNLSTLKINDLIYFKCVIDGAEIDMMKSEEYGYCKFLARKFGFYDADLGYSYSVLEEGYEKGKLEDYLDSIVGNKLFDDGQQELSDLIIKELITLSCNTDYRTKKLKPSTLETIIRNQLELPYAVSNPKKESKGELRGKRFIVITKLS